MTRPNRKPDPAFDLPCPACGAVPGQGCLDDDGLAQPLTSMHIARVTQGEPLVVRHTGRFDADGGAILEEVKPDEGSA